MSILSCIHVALHFRFALCLYVLPQSAEQSKAPTHAASPDAHLYQSFEGSRTSDNNTFQATYDASVVGFNGQDILVADNDLNENDCREVTIQYSFDGQSGNCQLIYISPDLEEKVLSDSPSGSVAIQLQSGANYIGITGTDFSGSIQIIVK